MIIIGSEADKSVPRKVPSRDLDIMMTVPDFEQWVQKQEGITIQERTEDYVHITCFGEFDHIEVYLGHSNNSTEQLLKYCEDEVGVSKPAPLNVLYGIKMSHRYKRNSPHFLKTMRDIHHFRSKGANLDCEELARIVKVREEETYNYTHPDLSQSKENFFSGDGIEYVYDHDTIHLAVALGKRPAYTYYMKDGSDVMTSKEKFFQSSERIRLAGVYEEACVLALERSQIPFAFVPKPRDSFITALIKVCTSITSGWFREYAWEKFYTIISMYRNLGEDNYVRRYFDNESVLKPFGWDTELEQNNSAEV